MTEQKPLGYPCSLLIWDKQGYHECKGSPIFDSEGKPGFCMCYLVAEATVDSEKCDEYEKNAPYACPKKYTWKQMEEKIGPAVEYALKTRNQEETKCELDNIESVTVTYKDKEQTFIPGKEWTWKQLEAIKKDYFLNLIQITYKFKAPNSLLWRQKYTGDMIRGYSLGRKVFRLSKTPETWLCAF